MATSTRKVNKPRLSLRKETKVELSGLMESIVTLFFGVRYDVDSFVNVTPQQMEEILAKLTAKNGTTRLTGMTRRYLRSYIKQHNLKDWTR